MKKSVLYFSLLALFLGGYALGAFLGFPLVGSETGQGDISKVNKFYKASVESKESAFQQKLKTDSTALNEAFFIAEVFSTKMFEFSDLVKLSVDVAGDIPELNNEIEALKEITILSNNASKAGEVAMASYNKLKTGENSELAIDVEQATQNLSLAYILIDRQVALGKNFVTATDKYLAKNAENENLALVRDMWIEYCAENAILNGDKKEYAYWSGKSNLLDAQKAANTSLVLSAQLQEMASNTYEGVAGYMFNNNVASKATENVIASKQTQISNGGLMVNVDINSKASEDVIYSKQDQISNGGLMVNVDIDLDRLFKANATILDTKYAEGPNNRGTMLRGKNARA